ncbi:asparagine synthase [Paenibacillus sp. LPE1-1-1.1]|uniref:asparagine synthase n=1 Tax=Paenibacillaceae TaxID=186822 RepID=UPI003448BB86
MKEGLIPTVLGTAVTATGASLLGRNRQLGVALIGFGAAHIVLGAIDLIEHRKQNWM